MLLLATDQQKLDRDRLSHEAWGQRLTVEEFVTREEQLRSHPWAQRAMQTWLLIDERGSILSSCESFQMESVARDPSRDDSAPSSPPPSRASYAIASVFTEPALRGRGHAVRMLSLLTERLRAIDEAAHASVLYSDVGAAIYERCGYVAIPAAKDRVFEPAPGDPAEGVELLCEGDVERALARIPRPRADLLIWPTAAQIDWHLERERAYSSLLKRERPAGCGARVGGSSILWASGFKSNELYVLLLHAESPQELGLLLQSARRAAGRAGLTRVVHWEHPIPFGWPEGPDSGALHDRDGGLPMLCPLDPSVSPSDWTIIPRALWV